MSIVEDDQKAPFSIATTLRCREGATSFPKIVPLSLDTYIAEEVSSTIFKVFGMTRPGIEPMSREPLAITLPTRPIYI